MKPLVENSLFPIKNLRVNALNVLKLGLVLAFFCPIFALAQTLQAWDLVFKDASGKTFPMPLVGGLNSPQLSAVDLNADGVQDLYVFDRSGNKQLTFINDGVEGQSSYRYAPEYLEGFPTVINWVLLRDFNEDGVMDLFSFPNLQLNGIMAYKGSIKDGKIHFDLIEFDRPLNVIYFSPSSGSDLPIFISNIDYPAIDDMDCDGDLDILTFNSTGGYIELYENQSIERGFGKDTLLFNLRERCWGGLFESGNSNLVDLSTGPNDCFSPEFTSTPVEVRHTGSTLLTFDADGDGDRELILGDVSFDALNYLTNEGDCQTAWMGSQDPAFPSDDQSVNLPVFPAAFYLDINNDGVEEIMVAPNVDAGGESKEVLWQYSRGVGEGGGDFGLVRKDWLVSDMVDLGENSYPCFVDLNQDEVMDIVVGNGTFYEPLGAKNARVFYFENTGTNDLPVFELREQDLFSLNQFSQAATDFSPTFGDLDGDNDLDALIGEINGQLFYAENIAGEGQPMSFANVQYGYMDIDVGFNSRPQLVDVNGDQLLDLLIGEQSGNINYFPNQGTQTNPVFTADPSQAPNQMVWGGVVAPTDGLAFSGYSSPFLTKVDEEWQLFVGNRIGTVERYGDIQGNLEGDFTLLGDIPVIDVGAEATIGLANIGGDEYLNLIVGNKRGGIELWETPYAPFLNVSTTGDPALPGLEWQIVPNPSRDQFQINIKEDGSLNWHWEVFSADGQRIKVGQSQTSTENISLATYPSGVYWVRLKLGERLSTKKLLLLD